MNLLISCIGRQLQLMGYFLKALDSEDTLYVSDTNRSAPAMLQNANTILAISYDSPNYEQWLLQTIEKHKITLLITLSVDELQVLNRIRNSLKYCGCHLVGASEKTIKIGQDKIETARFCRQHGIKSPATRVLHDYNSSNSVTFPSIVKQQFGKGSRGVQLIDNREDYTRFLETKNPRDIFVSQEFIEGDEYGIDVVNDFNGKYVATFCRRKYKMVNGETDIAETVNDGQLQTIGAILGNKLKHEGSLDADLIKRDNTYYLLDINLRFGGGYAFSHNAGADLPSALVSWAHDRSPDPLYFQPASGIMSRRINGEVIRVNKKEKRAIQKAYENDRQL